MQELPSRPDLESLRRQAEDLLLAARQDAAALDRLRAVSDGAPTLDAAQLAVAHDHGFPSWLRLEVEVERRSVLDACDVDRLAGLLAGDPSLATAPMERWCDHRGGPIPLSYVAMLRYDTSRGEWRDVPGAAAMAEALLARGALVDGAPGGRETPLVTAASYGDADVARVLLAAGANIEAVAADDAGGVPGGTALLHAAVFGMTGVVDVLVGAGARVHGIEEAAAAGDISGWLTPETPVDARVRALVMAADHERLGVIEELVAAGTPVDGTDPVFGGHPLRTAARNGRPASVRTLLVLGADPDLRDPDEGLTPLEWWRKGREGVGPERHHDEVEAILRPVTRTVN